MEIPKQAQSIGKALVPVTETGHGLSLRGCGGAAEILPLVEKPAIENIADEFDATDFAPIGRDRREAMEGE